MIKPSLPKGTRDFSAGDIYRRRYIFDTIRSAFELYGFEPLETPAMENLSTLTGKYGDEGDQLIFKILNSGNYLSNVDQSELQISNFKSLTSNISEKALRYDLTIPFARYVVMNQHNLTMPFRRYQMQPVWRADRPQKGRYREFYQCDADVIGSDSLLCEVDLINIYDEVFSRLGIKVTIKINNRKFLAGITEAVGATDRFTEFTVILDKLDKIGKEGVEKELRERNFNEAAVEVIEKLQQPFKIEDYKEFLKNSTTGLKGIEEIEMILNYTKSLSLNNQLEIDVTLARGLNYYTGTILEIKTNNVQMGSIGGGGRYDDLTGMFGLKGLSGVGISFGVDRIYDVMEELKLFPEFENLSTQVLFTNFDLEGEKLLLQYAAALRKVNIATEVYPDEAKLQKQFKYADAKKIPFVAVVGSEERKKGSIKLKDMQTGEQKDMTIGELINKLKKQ